MAKTLFKTMSPLMGWFVLLEILSAACLVTYWVEAWLKGVRPWSQVWLGMFVTLLFLVSNYVLMRHRWWGVVGLLTSWILLVVWLLPTL